MNSILTQEFTRDFKVIVCDDASFDNTSDILTENFSNFENFHIFKNDENIGVSENFIKCTNQSSAKYIAILEGDDYWIEPNKLDLQIKAMEEYPETSFCFTDVRVEKNGIRENIHPNLGGKTRMFSAIDLVDQTGSIAQTCTLLIRRKFL